MFFVVAPKISDVREFFCDRGKEEIVLEVPSEQQKAFFKWNETNPFFTPLLKTGPKSQFRN